MRHTNISTWVDRWACHSKRDMWSWCSDMKPLISDSSGCKVRPWIQRTLKWQNISLTHSHIHFSIPVVLRKQMPCIIFFRCDDWAGRSPSKQGASAPEKNKIDIHRNKRIQPAKPQTEHLNGCITYQLPWNHNLYTWWWPLSLKRYLEYVMERFRLPRILSEVF